VYLRDILGLDEAAARTAGEPVRPKLRNTDEAFIVVTQVGNYRFGIVVDRVFDSEEIVVKPVAPILKDLKEFSGNTILGDGSVIMILDPNGITSATGEISVPESQEHEAVAARAKTFGDEAVELLLFRAGDSEPKAIPLSLVSRLEEFEAEKIENSNGRTVVQYRGRLMPLVPIGSSFQTRESGRQPVIVFAEGERTMGLLVDEIVDIVEENLAVELSSEQPGLIGSAIVAGKATGVLDAGYYLTRAFGDWFKRSAAGQNARGKRVLLVDDSPFFLNLIAPVLTTAGYKVTTANNAEDAIGHCDAGHDYDIIVSDIEMPGMNGFEFAAAVRQGSRWKGTPLVALSSRAGPEDIDRGLKAGFDRYVAKHDRDGLLAALTETATTAARV
jgi:two-component system chemotaxis sensor kinase CheA